MKKYYKTIFVIICISSFFIKMWINNKLEDDISNFKEKNLKYLEFKTNKNFTHFGIENVGSNLRDELLKMDVDKANIEIRKGIPFYFFQENKVYINNQKRTIVIFLKFDWQYNVFKIRGYQTVM